MNKLIKFLLNLNKKPMKLTLIRKQDDHKATVGHLYINGELFCFTLEDTFRHEKVSKKTRIPAGTYKIELRKGSPMADKYQSRFKTNGMLWLQDVPDFTFVYIHVGNTEDDTDGCILVGGTLDEKIDRGEIKSKVLSSADTYIELWGKINSEIELGNQVFISVIDN